MTLRVQIIDTNTGDFIGKVLDFNLLLGNTFISYLSLLEKVGRGLLNSLLLRSVIDDIVSDGFGLCVELHDRFLEEGLLIKYGLLLNIHAFTFGFCLG